jgi:hypothetical protein
MKCFMFGLGLVLASAGLASASPLKSLYTTIAVKECRRISSHADGHAWRCRGLDGYPVYFAEGDLRTFVAVGPKAESTRAAEQTLGPFNSLFPNKKSRRSTLEWRFVRQDGRVVPYATILRYFTSNETGKGQVLIVSKVVGNDVCHVAYIDALANPDAIALARKVADETARNFDCKSGPMTVGKTGRSPM